MIQEKELTNMQTKTEYESNLSKYIKEHELTKIKTEILFTNSIRMNYQMAHISCNDKAIARDIKDYFNVFSFLNNSYQFVYHLKKHRLEYSHGVVVKHGLPKHKAFKIINNNWGNINIACRDMHNYDWFSKNEHAMHILDIDPESFYEMQYFLGVFLDYLQEQKANNQKKKDE